MTFREIILLSILFMVIQTIIIIVLTRINSKFFDKRHGYAYARAVADLTAKKPIAGWAIRVCYLAFVVELVFLLIFKSK